MRFFARRLDAAFKLSGAFNESDSVENQSAGKPAIEALRQKSCGLLAPSDDWVAA